LTCEKLLIISSTSKVTIKIKFLDLYNLALQIYNGETKLIHLEIAKNFYLSRQGSTPW